MTTPSFPVFRPGLLLSALLLVACPSEQTVTISKFRVRVHCQTQEGRAVGGVLLASGTSSVRTDGQGNATLPFEGHEGEEVSFRIERLPSGLELVDHTPLRRVVLKSYGHGDPDRSGISDLQHDIALRNKKDAYTVLVYADDAPNLPVVANGAPVAKLNSRGAAAFRYEGKQGEELIVSISTGNNPRASLQDPKKTFQLGDTERLLLFHSELAIAAQPPPKRATPKSTKPNGPIRIDFKGRKG